MIFILWIRRSIRYVGSSCIILIYLETFFWPAIGYYGVLRLVWCDEPATKNEFRSIKNTHPPHSNTTPRRRYVVVHSFIHLHEFSWVLLSTQVTLLV